MLGVQFIQGSTLNNSHFFVMLEANTSPGSPIQGESLKARLVVTLDGNSLPTSNCNLNFEGGSTYSQCQFTVAVHDYGTYALSATISANNNIVSQTNLVTIMISQSGVTTETTSASSSQQSTTTTETTNTQTPSFTTSTSSSIVSSTNGTVTSGRSVAQDSSVGGGVLVAPALLPTLSTAGFFVMIAGIALLLLARRNH